LWAAIGCASGAAESGSAPPPTSEPQSEGGEAEASEALEAVEAPAEAPRAARSGPSTITVNVEVDGKPAEATVRLLAGSTEAAGGASGQAMTVDSGDYTMEVQIADDSLVDKPRQRRALTLLPGGNVTETVDFPWSKIQLKVRVNGALDQGAQVHLMRNGEKVVTLKSNAPHVPISPGRYQAVVKTRGAEIEVQQLMFPQGATQTVPVAVSM
jgi:hypothetical protein